MIDLGNRVDERRDFVEALEWRKVMEILLTWSRRTLGL